MSALSPYPVSESNTTSTPLAAGATWQGTGDEVADAGSMSVTVYTNTDSAPNGLCVMGSQDRITWHVVASVTVIANGLSMYDIPVRTRYVRVRYQTQGAQTVFSLQTVYRARPAHATEPGDAIPVRLADAGGFVDDAQSKSVAASMLDVLESMATSLRITNMHLAEMAGETITDEDIEPC